MASEMVVWLDAAREALAPERIGSKAHGLWRMMRAGLSVPPAFVVTTDACRSVLANDARLSTDLRRDLAAGVRRLEAATGHTLGGVRRPLVVSIRSGAPVSMPGMLDTVIDVGLNETTVAALTRWRGNPHLSRDSYRRLIQSYAATVMGCDPLAFDHLARDACAKEGVDEVGELDALSLRDLVGRSLETYHALTGEPFPQDPGEQLDRAVEAVFRSWSGARAREYRLLNGIDGRLGTAATVQAMAFGNAGGTSGSGVGFTRNPATGANELYLDFLFDAQGEDVVAGRRRLVGAAQLEAILPAMGEQLRRVAGVLEETFGDMQDFELTVEDGVLWLLQTRAGQRTPWAACQIAVDMVSEGLCDPATALDRLADIDLDSLVRRRAAPAAGQAPIARATPASLGVATGAVALDSERAHRLRSEGRACILVRSATSTEDIAGLAASDGLLTATGGRTAHAAVVARHLDKVCLVDCPDLAIDLTARRLRIGDLRLVEGDVITLDGDTGDVYAGEVAVVSERPTRALATIARWRAPQRAKAAGA